MMIMDVAQERIAAFERRFGLPHLDFACHAAVPLAVTPDLLYQLWGHFNWYRPNQPLNIPWVAVSDLILSGLCEEVGYELYEMKMDVRQALLARLRDDPRFGEGRLRQVVGLLLAYVRNDAQRDDLYLKDQEFKESQQWTAWAYFEPVKTVEALAAEFERAYGENPADLMRLVSLTEVLHQPIGEFDQLRIFARAMGHFCRNRLEDCRGEVIQLTVKNNQVHLGNGIKINVPPEFLIVIKTFCHHEIMILSKDQVYPTQYKAIKYVYFNRGNTYYKLKQYKEAIKDYTEAIHINPSDSYFYNNRGNAYYKLKRYEEAIKDYTSAIEIDPNNAYPYNNRGNVYSELKRYEEAIADYTEAIHINPSDSSSYNNNHDDVYSELKEWEDTIADYTRVIEKYPRDSSSYKNRGNTYYKLERYEDALSDYTRAIEIKIENEANDTYRWV